MNLTNALVLSNRDQRIFGCRNEGLNFCAPETFRADLGYSAKVDEYAVGVLAYYMFSGGEFPYLIPQSIKKDERIYRFISKTCIDFKQSSWSRYNCRGELEHLIRGLLSVDEKKRISAADALNHSLFTTKIRTELLKNTNFTMIQQRLRFIRDPRQINELNLVKRGILYFISQRVLPEEKHREYRQIFRLLEHLTSKHHDGLLRQSEIRAFTKESKLDASFANQLD